MKIQEIRKRIFEYQREIDRLELLLHSISHKTKVECMECRWHGEKSELSADIRYIESVSWLCPLCESDEWEVSDRE